jgi:hypothetical protein
LFEADPVLVNPLVSQAEVNAIGRSIMYLEGGGDFAAEGKVLHVAQLDARDSWRGYALNMGALCHTDILPKGQTPDQIAGQGLPPERAGIAHDRARTFLKLRSGNGRRPKCRGGGLLVQASASPLRG